MKLLSRISLYYLFLSSFVLGSAGILLYIFLRNEISLEIKEQLELQVDMITREINKGNAVNYPLVSISKGDEQLMHQPKAFKDTLIYDYVQKASEGYYIFAESKRINNKPYRIKVMTTYIGWDNYSKTITFIFISIAAALILLGTFFNYFISRNLWAPFLINLRRMQGYSVSSKDELKLASTNIREFKEMNAVLTDLAARGKREYTALKEFTENASHEIQTPLSILKARLESMSQLPLDTTLIKPLNDAKQAVRRLSKVNKGLLLLAKLENNSFIDLQTLPLNELLQRSYESMNDLFQHKAINIMFHITPKSVHASAFLMEVLISNLLSNMLSHGAPASNASITLNEQEMIFSNEGDPLSFSESKLFTRFGKGVPGYEGNGLGLSIVKQICLLNDWQISYNYKNTIHTFIIQFPV